MRDKVRHIALTVLAGVLVFAMTGCACALLGGGRDDGGASDGNGASAGGSAGAIETFFDASTKHGTLTFSSEYSDEQQVEYWFDGERYRLTWYYDDGSVRMHMISPDGEHLYYCRVGEQRCEIAYVLPENHHWIFNGPPDWAPGEGVEEDGLTKYVYTAKKLWDIAGASQQFYLEDLTIYADDTRIVKVITRTNASEPESEEDLVTSTYEFDAPEINIDILEETFELPYDIVK